MFDITIHNTISNQDKQFALETALGIIIENDNNTCAELLDGDTGELLFAYKNGNVDYIAGDFAKAMLDTLTAQTVCITRHLDAEEDDDEGMDFTDVAW